MKLKVDATKEKTNDQDPPHRRKLVQKRLSDDERVSHPHYIRDPTPSPPKNDNPPHPSKDNTPHSLPKTTQTLPLLPPPPQMHPKHIL